jgi:hypothetical protein
VVFTLCFSSSLYGEVLERVVAFVDDIAITLTEFENYYTDAKRLSPDITPEEAIQTLINRNLLLREAERLKIRGRDDDEKIRRYIEIKIRLYVRVSDSEIERYYKENIKSLGSEPLDILREDIKRLLIEKKTNALLEKHLKKLREKAYIRINYIPEY